MSAVASVHDVAAYILRERGSMSAMKLQKLVYYSQAWHMVWADEQLFDEAIQAWANGPVVYQLFDAHRGRYTVGPDWPSGNATRLDKSQIGSIDAVLSTYGDLTGRQLSVLTHDEEPWQRARAGLSATAPSQRTVSLEDMADFYGALDNDEDAKAIGEIDWTAWERAGD